MSLSILLKCHRNLMRRCVKMSNQKSDAQEQPPFMMKCYPVGEPELEILHHLNEVFLLLSVVIISPVMAMIKPASFLSSPSIPDKEKQSINTALMTRNK